MASPTRDLGDRGRTALALGNLAEIHTVGARYERAAALWEESLALFRELGMPSVIAYTLQGLAETEYYRGDHGRAVALLRECLALYIALGFHLHTGDALDILALMAWDRGEMERAVGLFGAGAAARASADAVHSPNRRAHTDRTLAAARAALGADAFAAAWDAGMALSMGQAAAYATEEPGEA